MTKLVRIVRDGNEKHPVMFDELRGEPQFIDVEEVTWADGDPYKLLKTGEFFLVEDRYVDETMRFFAERNPGCNVEVYTLEKAGICPAGAFLAKQVTEDGLLPF